MRSHETGGKSCSTTNWHLLLDLEPDQSCRLFWGRSYPERMRSPKQFCLDFFRELGIDIQTGKLIKMTLSANAVSILSARIQQTRGGG